MDVGYEVGSWALRKYRVNDMSTIRRGIDDNLTEYLEEDLGYVQERALEDIRLWLMFLSMIVAAVAQFAPIPFEEAKVFLLVCIVIYYSLALATMYISNLEGDHLLVATAKETPIPLKDRCYNAGVVATLKSHLSNIGSYVCSTMGMGPQKGTSTSLGFRLRVRSTAAQFTPVYHVQFEAVEAKNSRWRRPAVIASLKKEWPVGSFFDEAGYIYPPNIKKEADAALAELHQKIKKRR